MKRPVSVEAAVAVLIHADGRVLLGQRPEGKPWAGWWEFPGGKIEAGETPFHALQRELHEELGVEATTAYPWITRTFAYPERTVKLHFFKVHAWLGEPHGREGQQLAWQALDDVTVGPLLPANAPVIAALRLPAIYAITNLHELGEPVFFERLQVALQHGLRLVQVREKQLSLSALREFAARVIALCRPYGAKVLLNGETGMAQQVGADGVHLSAACLMAMQSRPESLLCAASCHNSEELQKAAELGLDFVLLSPVQPTLSHPGTTPLGWGGFAQLLGEYPLPVFALGGMRGSDLHQAWLHGAQGVAMQRQAWEME